MVNCPYGKGDWGPAAFDCFRGVNTPTRTRGVSGYQPKVTEQWPTKTVHCADAMGVGNLRSEIIVK